ncbi:ParB/RepB/Spo0J family partition protein [Anaeroselena agilis]|uniref:ParB/RepB/Spo0J family partition protein n=1 Tax=Anaeroselena agilis TaxID=3063788 RepID=A0ABU3NXL7_9FIRM|nr:ParB/RepB/Spo0J family partition protein [Selenomonadales bacterium 4137-cl]
MAKRDKRERILAVKLVEIDINLIDEDSEQPRREFDKTAIDELAESIREVGLLNPIKVYKAKYGRYKIVFGNRRYKALKLLGFRKIPCILSDNTDELDIYFEQLTENIQRRDFTPIEEAEGFQKLLDGEKWQVSKKFLASRLGKSEKYITNKLALLVFGPEVRKIIHAGPEILAGKLSEDQALGMKDVPLAYRDHLALKVARDQRSARDAKRIAGLFMDEGFDAATKERFLKMPCHELVALSVDAERRQELAKAAAARNAEAETAPAADVASAGAPAQAAVAATAAPAGAGAAAEPDGSEAAAGLTADGDAKAASVAAEVARLLAVPAVEALTPEALAALGALEGAERERLLAAVEARAAELARLKAALEQGKEA